MSLSKNLRSRKSVDYKKLNEGEELPRILTTKHAVRTPATVLPDSYSVERIIDRKETTEVIITYLYYSTTFVYLSFFRLCFISFSNFHFILSVYILLSFILVLSYLFIFLSLLFLYCVMSSSLLFFLLSSIYLSLFHHLSIFH